MTDERAASIEVFIKPDCPYCQALKHKLEHDGMPYVDHNVQADPDALQRMLALNGGRHNVPTLRMGDQVTVGFHGM